MTAPVKGTKEWYEWLYGPKHKREELAQSMVYQCLHGYLQVEDTYYTPAEVKFRNKLKEKVKAWQQVLNDKYCVKLDSDF
jgi:uncharacterized protein YecE (DUF72 family)